MFFLCQKFGHETPSVSWAYVNEVHEHNQKVEIVLKSAVWLFQGFGANFVRLKHPKTISDRFAICMYQVKSLIKKLITSLA